MGCSSCESEQGSREGQLYGRDLHDWTPWSVRERWGVVVCGEREREREKQGRWDVEHIPKSQCNWWRNDACGSHHLLVCVH